MKKEFISFYDKNVDEIYTHFFKKTSHHAEAKRLTLNYFKYAWDSGAIEKQNEKGLTTKWDIQESFKNYKDFNNKGYIYG
jgi:hypothetical protein